MDMFLIEGLCIGKIIIVFLASILGGIVDAIIGCGSLVTLPSMFLVGIPVHVSIATNKLQGTFGTIYSSYSFYKEKQLTNLKKLTIPFFIVLLFSLIGAKAIQYVSDEKIKKILPIITGFLVIYKMLNFKKGLRSNNFIKNEDKNQKSMILIASLIGFYDGFLGPASGTIWISILIAFFGYNLLQASGVSKFFNVAGNIGVLPIFIFHNLISYKLAFIMIIGQVIGTKIGVFLSVKNGSIFINRSFLILMPIVTIYLIFKYWIVWFCFLSIAKNLLRWSKININLFILILIRKCRDFRRKMDYLVLNIL